MHNKEKPKYGQLVIEGSRYLHKVSNSLVRVDYFFEKQNIPYVKYTYVNSRHQGARPVQSFKDTFRPEHSSRFDQNDYMFPIIPGGRYVEETTREMVTVLHLINAGDMVKYEYIRAGGKHIKVFRLFQEQFRPWSGFTLTKAMVESGKWQIPQKELEQDSVMEAYVAVFLEGGAVTDIRYDFDYETLVEKVLLVVPDNSDNLTIPIFFVPPSGEDRLVEITEDIITFSDIKKEEPISLEERMEFVHNNASLGVDNRYISRCLIAISAGDAKYKPPHGKSKEVINANNWLNDYSQNHWLWQFVEK